MQEVKRWTHSSNLVSGTGRVSNITPTPNSYWFAARPVYGSSGDDPPLGPWSFHRYEDWNDLGAQSSDTPTVAADPDGDNFLLTYELPQSNTADFGAVFLFKRSGRIGIGFVATSITVEIRGVEIIEYPFT